MDALSNASASFLTTALESKMRCILAPTAITSSEDTQKNNVDINMRISIENKVYHFKQN